LQRVIAQMDGVVTGLPQAFCEDRR
jgi:hypothetical protein